MRVLFAGTPAVAVPSLDALLAAGLDIIGVLTRPDAPIGRKRVLTPSPVAQRAQELGLPVIRAARIDQQACAEIAALAPEVAAIVAYGAMIPADALSIPPLGWINLHFSLLPAWRGAAPVQHSILHGDDVTGASTFALETGLDTGPVYGTLTELIRPTDTGSALLERLSHSGAVLLVQTLSALASGRANAQPQRGEITLAPKLSIEDGRIDWSEPALAIGRRIRAVTAEPGAWTMLADQRIKLGPVRLSPDVRLSTDLRPSPDSPLGTDSPLDTSPLELPPGRLAVGPKSVVVGTGSHPVELVQVQPAGKKIMQATDWARGLADREDMVFQ
ncbi:methionyl-tRNA formyltransferase [Arthrobacter sp. H14-L1]|uniref:methionyl-tRNA formyltransferase n=1 Tax=Arthrobacter sp. H14-L1 TaxID=2996697 RepID=UPI0022722C5A|nr:methionyl-tRNA formyltransferase [Arthrobacter sp. H14-L1]MCY0904342.1 methionyl-tRNA formyltransferase [Arthrobacter sp. H14-L1]